MDLGPMRRGLRSLAATGSRTQRERKPGEVVMPNLGVAIVRQYQRGVVFRLGKVRDVREPSRKAGARFRMPLHRQFSTSHLKLLGTDPWSYP